MMDTASMQGPIAILRARAGYVLAILCLTANALQPAMAAPRELADLLAPRKPSCHARVFDAAELAAHPGQRVTAIALERTARDLAAERKWSAFEQFDDTPVVSATLRVRLRGDQVSHAVRLAC